MSLPANWPYRVKSGNTTVPIYHSKTTRGYDEFKCVWYDGDKKRRFKTFSDFEEAKNHATGVNAAINAGDVHALTLTNQDRLVYLRAIDALRTTGIALDSAAIDFAAAVKHLGSVSLQEAVKFYIKHNTGLESRTVSKVVAELIRSKESPSKNKKPASAKYLADLNSRLGRFEDSFHCNIADIQPKQIEDFLNALPEISGRTWFNHARLIRTLFKFAKAKKYIPANIDPMEGIDIDFEDDREIEIFTPEELTKLFVASRPEVIPFLAIGAFAGVRHAEIARLDWKHISETHIEITAKGAKTRARRVIPIQPNLAKWLALHRQLSGPVSAFSNMSKQLLWLADEAKIDWKHNALRHSFISYRLAKTNDENLTAVEAGNSPTMIQHHYRQIKDHTGRVITSELANAWFSIQPEQAANVVQDDRARAILGKK